MSLGRVTIPSGASFEQTARTLNDLIKRMPNVSEEIKNVKNLRDGLTNVTQRVKEVKQSASDAQQLAKEAQNKVKELRGLAKEFEKVKKQLNPLNRLLQNLKKGLFKEIMPAKFANVLSLGAGLFATGMSFALLNHIGELQEYDLRKESIRNVQSNIEFRIAQKAFIRVQALQRLFDKLKADLDATKKNIYGDVSGALKNSVLAREKANDALYEARQGRKILDGKIDNIRKSANDALYEVRQGRKLLDAQIQVIRKIANDALFETRQGRVKTDAKIDSTNQQVNQLKQKIPQLEAKINAIKPENNASLNARIDKLSSDTAKALLGVATIPSVATKIVAELLGKFKLDFDAKLNQKLDKAGLIPAVQANATSIFNILKPSIQAFVLPLIQTAVLPLSAFDTGLKLSLDIIGTKVSAQDNKIKDVERVNQEGNNKLDRMLPLLLGFPALVNAVPQTTIDKFNQQVSPKIPEMTATGTCRTLQPGGCMRRSLDDLGNGINSNTNNSNNNLFNKINAGFGAANAGANATILNVVNRIDNKMGALIPNGGLSSALSRIFENGIVDRAINTFALILAFHNAAMLSNSLFQSILGAGDLILQALGFKVKDAEGNQVDLNQSIGILWQQFLTGLLGVETVKQINETWAKWNRIYQSAANLLSLTQSMFDSLRSVLEISAQYTGKIGNALKSAGVVFDDAYDWMSERLSSARGRLAAFQRFSEGLERAENVTSNIASVAGSVVSVQSELNEFKQEQTNFSNALNNQKDEKTQTENQSTQASKSPTISIVQERNPNS